MRRRSCALHSDSEEEFLLLAQYANDKTGFFYDDTLHSEITEKLNIKLKSKELSKPQLSLDNFAGFDFGVEDAQKIQEQEQLSADNKSRQVNFVVICKDQIGIMQKLKEMWPDKSYNQIQPQEQRQIDLFIIKIHQSNIHTYCFKFWLIDPNKADNPICKSYMKRAYKIINFSRTPNIGELWPEQNAKGVLFSIVNPLIS